MSSAKGVKEDKLMREGQINKEHNNGETKGQPCVDDLGVKQEWVGE